MKAEFLEVNLDDAILSRARLFRANLLTCSLRGASLEDADLAYAHLKGSDLRSLDLDRCVLNRTHFVNCLMAGILGNPDLRGPLSITGADVSPDGDGSDIQVEAYFDRLWHPVID